MIKCDTNSKYLVQYLCTKRYLVNFSCAYGSVYVFNGLCFIVVGDVYSDGKFVVSF
jgi:hypothetical protein